MSWGIVATVGGSLIGGMLSGSGNGAQSGSNNPGYYDPYSQYRGQAATKLNQLMSNPNQYLSQTPTYGAMLDAAQRQGASQGYNGSGNALVAAANAGGQAYQQEFNNLAMLSGASANPAQAGALAAQQGNYNTQMNNQMWGGLGSMFGRASSSIFNGGGSGDGLGVVYG